ncbi:MAG: hypothetical protein A3I07_01085 [Candidatus Doudnabacteria bacterium RIFCSPLOWO2_02_FULL_42_9]|uniref:Uncharacterized protein n=1 Tax=Candidatus Doudnabacteria bacterium RIFCSPHIGHO2_01_FULL_41_86 TaxID=1817821 RepID=A0A1F5N7H6_9BACT|nr:MAG: hypothetical protein A2717_00095 [Candidatus Doudnabacteria bacterium RIFCSPHIGHO2_01_FULL_41_86]OGE74967.1 MAG: hypothetical protein A3K07_03585 [Candidatus Doudnabacteria bacterium RIFCSPHIGHO2_01_43_10]OGE85622.1 MAG: hypothetical protein A3E28_04660 [Candidatus Doudnabacteria bacterium RIFCSPHIGHO2_12_FULL_42_22]OGE86559.1 MAG: hypothetical protein A3C49_00095 [Candidatus Doudnabacteria bacterium RIFCSPHIGHO2_02_FULL_42_25]OGE91976.1 MAG: hypothetical protein A2895_01240 [Candidatus
MDKFFWYFQPSTLLSVADKLFIYIFIAILAIAILLRIVKRFVRNAVHRKLLTKFWHLTFTLGISGIIWSVFRYENTPLFARRYWAGLIFLAGIVWLLFILKYLIFNYRRELFEFGREQVKSKYMPGRK